MNNQDKLADELSELLNIEVEIRETVIGTTSSKTNAMAGIGDKLRQWLKKVQEIAAQHDVQSYTITLSLGWPPGIQASFTWLTEDKDPGIGGFR